jgi:hypothetical protein
VLLVVNAVVIEAAVIDVAAVDVVVPLLLQLVRLRLVFVGRLWGSGHRARQGFGLRAICTLRSEPKAAMPSDVPDGQQRMQRSDQRPPPPPLSNDSCVVR